MRATECFSDMADYLNEIDWYKFPVRLQKNIVFIVQNVQPPMNYHGLGLIFLDLETFTNVRFSLLQNLE